MQIEFKRIPKAEDSDKHIMVDGVRVGVVARGWLRLGGEQWIAHLPNRTIGAPTLADMKKAIEYWGDRQTFERELGTGFDGEV